MGVLVSHSQRLKKAPRSIMLVLKSSHVSSSIPTDHLHFSLKNAQEMLKRNMTNEEVEAFEANLAKKKSGELSTTSMLENFEVTLHWVCEGFSSTGLW